MSQSLPGLYWLNAFGSRYVDLLGRDQLFSAPALVEEMDSTVVLALSDDGRRWNTDEYRKQEAEVRAHLGRQFFYSKGCFESELVGPDFGFQTL